MITFAEYFERYVQHNKRKLTILYRPASAVLDIQCALQAAAPRLPMLRRLCHSYSAELPTRRLTRLQFRDCLYCFWSNQLLCIRLP